MDAKDARSTWDDLSLHDVSMTFNPGGGSEYPALENANVKFVVESSIAWLVPAVAENPPFSI
jgi:hypothetical protein